MSEQLIMKASSFTKDDVNNFISQIKIDNKDMNYYSRINAIGIYKLVTELPYNKDYKEERLLDSLICL